MSSFHKGEIIKRIHSAALLLAFFLSACRLVNTPNTPSQSSNSDSTTALTVFAAASLTDAFTDIGTEFEAANPDTTIIFNFSGSQSLRTQIEEGAPADVFASASSKEMETLVTRGFVTADMPKVFLANQLIVILPADNPAALKKLQDLANPGIKLILAAEEVPVGNYARQALEKMNGSFGSNFKDKVLANVISNEDNVKQVIAKVQLGEADAGMVYVSDAIAVPELISIDIHVELNVVAQYPIAPLIQSKKSVLASLFIEYVLSPKGQSIFKKWGFLIL